MLLHDAGCSSRESFISLMYIYVRVMPITEKIGQLWLVAGQYQFLYTTSDTNSTYGRVIVFFPSTVYSSSHLASSTTSNTMSSLFNYSSLVTPSSTSSSGTTATTMGAQPPKSPSPSSSSLNMSSSGGGGSVPTYSKLAGHLAHRQWDKAIQILSTNEGRVMTNESDRHGRYPIHQALLLGAPATVISALIRANETHALLACANNTGEIPLHMVRTYYY